VSTTSISGHAPSEAGNAVADTSSLQRMTPRAKRLLWIGVLAIFSLVYLGSLFSPALLDDADATHSEAAREMYRSGDWVTLHVDGIRYLEKAPLIYWLIASSYHVFGVSEASTRLPLTLAMLLTVLLAGDWARRALGDRTGVLAALFVTTSIGFYLFTRITIPEALLSFFIALSFYCFIRALNSPAAHARWFWYGAYAALALAVLTKGLLSLVVVGGTVFLFLLFTGQWRRWREIRLVSGTLLFLALAAPWHLLAGFRNHGFFWFYFVNEHFLRFLGKRYPKDYNKLPALAYWSLHLVWLFPWSLFAPVVVKNLLARWKERRSVSGESWSFADQTRFLCFLWAAVVLVFFAFSTNQEYYTFPAYFPLIVLVADALISACERPSRWQTAGYAVLLFLGAAGALALFGGLWSSRNLPFQPDVGAALAERGIGNYTLSMSHFFDLTDASFAGLRLPATMAAIAFLVGPLAALYLHLRRKSIAAVWSIAVFSAVFLFSAHLALVRFEPFLSSRVLAQQTLSLASQEDTFMIYGDQSYGSSWIFYLGKQVLLVNGRSTSMEFGSRFPDAPKIFLTDSDLADRWHQGGRVFLFAPLRNEKKLRSLLGDQMATVARTSADAVYSNR
jgi:4-amino-4-deoxy-L-arabinose transferase-like glycosyltransferase